jgi:ubiquinone/menaquinone biosynthesis C-methylase UbiE
LIEFLPRVVPNPPDRPEIGGPDHPMRKVTRQVAFDPDGWTPERAGKVAQLFDTLAPEWSERTRSERQDALRDALARGGFGEAASGVCIEIGSGTGSSSDDLARRFATVLAADLSREMLRRAPTAPARRVNADGARLPIPDASVDAVVLVNALLFPAEVARVLAPGGALVWINSLGDKTPIHLPAEDVAKAMPGSFAGVASEAGWGTWCVLRRTT